MEKVLIMVEFVKWMCIVLRVKIKLTENCTVFIMLPTRAVYRGSRYKKQKYKRIQITASESTNFPVKFHDTFHDPGPPEASGTEGDCNG